MFPIPIIQNEKRKDKEVTARIERILKLRDQAMEGVDMGARTMFISFAHADEDNAILTSRYTGKVEQKVDHLVRICNYYDHPIAVALNVTSAS